MARIKYQTKIGPQIRHASELEMGTDMHAISVKQTTVILAICLVVLAVFNSEALVDWAMKLPVGPVGDGILWAAGEWHDLMEKIGATALHRVLREAFMWFKEL